MQASASQWEVGCFQSENEFLRSLSSLVSTELAEMQASWLSVFVSIFERAVSRPWSEWPVFIDTLTWLALLPIFDT